MLLPDVLDYKRLLAAVQDVSKETGIACTKTEMLLLGILQKLDELVEVEQQRLD